MTQAELSLKLMTLNQRQFLYDSMMALSGSILLALTMYGQNLLLQVNRVASTFTGF